MSSFSFGSGAPTSVSPAFVSALSSDAEFVRAMSSFPPLELETALADAGRVAAARGWVAASGDLMDDAVLRERWDVGVAPHCRDALGEAVCYAGAMWLRGAAPCSLTVVVRGELALPLLAVALRGGARSLTCFRVALSPGRLSHASLGTLSPLSGLTRLYSVRLESYWAAPAAMRWWVAALGLHRPPGLRHLDLELQQDVAEAGPWEAPFPPALTDLALRGADEEMANGLGAAVAAACPGLERLTLEYNSLSPDEPQVREDAARLLAGLPRLRFLTIDGRGKGLGTGCWEAVARMRDLQELRLTCVECAPGHEAALDGMLHAGLGRLERLTLTHSFHGELRSGRRLTQVLRSAASLPSLTSLSCTHFSAFRMTRPEMQAVVEAVAAIVNGARLQSLCLASLPMDDALMGVLAASLRQLNSLEVFSLNDFGCEEAEFKCSSAGLSCLGAALACSKTLRTASVDFGRLLVDGEKLDDACAAVLSHFMDLRYLSHFLTGRLHCRPKPHSSLAPEHFPKILQQLERWHRLRRQEAACKAAWGVVSQGLVRQQERRVRQPAAPGRRTPPHLACPMAALPASVLLRSIGSYLDEPNRRLLIA